MCFFSFAKFSDKETKWTYLQHVFPITADILSFQDNTIVGDSASDQTYPTLIFSLLESAKANSASYIAREEKERMKRNKSRKTSHAPGGGREHDASPSGDHRGGGGGHPLVRSYICRSKAVATTTAAAEAAAATTASEGSSLGVATAVAAVAAELIAAATATARKK